MKNLLVLLLITLLLSCDSVDNKSVQNDVESSSEKDSITISVKLPPNKRIHVGTWTEPYENLTLKFRNNSDKDSIITKKIPLVMDTMVLFNRTDAYHITGKINLEIRTFIATKEILNFNLEYNGVRLVNANKDIPGLIIDSFENNYLDQGVKIFQARTETERQNRLEELEDLHTKYKSMAVDDELSMLFNDLNYYYQLQRHKPFDKRIEAYVTSMPQILHSQSQSRLADGYFKNRVLELNYDELNTENHTKNYVDLMAISAYRFLKDKNNKGKNRYKKVEDWLKSTEFYKKDSTHILKMITPIVQKVFVEKLGSIVLSDKEGSTTDIVNVISNNPSEYYLLDFWATWCAPCLGGLRAFEELELPTNVKVINISLDKESDLDKWKEMHGTYKIDISYWFKGGEDANKEFYNLMKIKSIPRYILIDKNLRLIDEAFYHTYQPQFLPKLYDVKNHAKW